MNMKRFLYFVCLCCLSTVTFAQKIYVNDVLLHQKQLEVIPVTAIKKMDKLVEDGNMVVRILLKEQVNADSLIAVAKNVKVSAKEEEKKEPTAADTLAYHKLREYYDKSTILKKGDKAASFVGKKYRGEEVSLDKYRGKVVLLQFWATWCGPCLIELHPKHLPAQLKPFIEHPDFVFLPVAYTNSADDLRIFFSTRNGQTYTYLQDITLTDKDKSIMKLYAHQNIPRSVLIGRDGTILYGSVGINPIQTQELLEEISRALK